MSAYKESRFTIVEPLAMERTGLFNTLSRALTIVPDQVWLEASSGRGYARETPGQLVQQGFLVAEDIDEDAVLTHHRNLKSYDLSHLNYRVVTTESCNLGCTGCPYDRVGSRGREMNGAVAREVLDFIMADVSNKRPLSVRLDLVGAEAALNSETALYLAEGLFRFCQGRRLDFRIGLDSNGLALTADWIDSLKPFGLTDIQITLGGPAELHDRSRPDRNGAPTYERIMNNLVAAAGRVRIMIKMLYDPSNGDYLAMPQLLDDLLDRGLKDSVSEVVISPGYASEKKRDAGSFTSAGVPAECLQETDPGRRLWLRDQTVRRGFKTALGWPESRCSANYLDTMIIDVDGGLTACPALIDHPDLDYGHVREGVDFRRQARLVARALPDECNKSCPVAPICDGGCRWQVFAKTGRYDGVTCLKNIFEQLILAQIRRAAAFG